VSLRAPFTTDDDYEESSDEEARRQRWRVPRRPRFAHPNPYLAPEAILFKYPHYLLGVPRWYESYRAALPMPLTQMFASVTGFATLRVSEHGVRVVFVDAEGRVVHQFAQLYDSEYARPSRSANTSASTSGAVNA
jgi:hypothetical protein